MPRQVDHEARRREIFEAATKVISDGGPRALSFRAVAEQLGGSTTVVTHYYPSQKELVDDLGLRLVNQWTEELEALESDTDDPYERLLVLLDFLLPVDARGKREERTRVAMLAENLVDDQFRDVFNAWDTKIREFLRDHVRGLVPDDEVETTVDILRVFTSGLGLTVTEHPRKWPRKRQVALAEELLQRLGITPDVVARRPVASP